MMEYFIPLLVVASLAIDYLFWRTRLAGLALGLRRGVVVGLLIVSLLPLLTLLEGKLRTDNLPEDFIFQGRWTILILLYSLARMILYIGWTSRRASMRSLSLLLACGAVGALTWGVVEGRTALRVEEVTIRSEKLPEGWHGTRLVHFSDLHIGSLLHPKEECRRLVDTILSLRPDLILFTGDLVHIRHTELSAEVMGELARLRAPLGVWSVTGNHDVGVYIKDSISLTREENTRLLIDKERQMGWRVLENESRFLIRGGDTLSLTGIGFERSLRNLRHARRLPDDYRPWALYDTLSPHHFNLTICHLPQLWDEICSHGYGDLTLSGHVHSMQHKLPIGRRGWSLSALVYNRWSGLYTEENRSLYINDGIGSVGIPARLGATPEVTLITLERR